MLIKTNNIAEQCELDKPIQCKTFQKIAKGIWISVLLLLKPNRIIHFEWHAIKQTCSRVLKPRVRVQVRGGVRVRVPSPSPQCRVPSVESEGESQVMWVESESGWGVTKVESESRVTYKIQTTKENLIHNYVKIQS